MGGKNQIVQIDESLMRETRKYVSGRVLQRNGVPPSRQNYGKTVVEPWIFGLVWLRQVMVDGKKRFENVSCKKKLSNSGKSI